MVPPIRSCVNLSRAGRYLQVVVAQGNSRSLPHIAVATGSGTITHRKGSVLRFAAFRIACIGRSHHASTCSAVSRMKSRGVTPFAPPMPSNNRAA